MITHAHQEHPELSIRRLCELFGVGRTWFYTHPSPEEIASRDVALRDAIERIVLEFPGYGYRRVTKTLQRTGWTVNHKRVLRVMRAESLLCQLKRRFVTTTDSRHGRPVYPNLIRDLRVNHLDQVWVADITYIRLPTTFAYLALSPGCLFPSLHRVVFVALDRHATDAGRLGDGSRKPSSRTRSDSSL